jgi:hypothetical protein
LVIGDGLLVEPALVAVFADAGDELFEQPFIDMVPDCSACRDRHPIWFAQDVSDAFKTL